MNDKLKIGLIGLGDIGSLHAQAAAQLDDLHLCIAAGRNANRAQTVAAETGADFYDSVDAMLSDASVQAVDICVPNHLHREFAQRAFAARKHVICEKPIALPLEDADAMIDAANRANRMLFIAHILRFWPEYVRTNEWLEADTERQALLISARRLSSLLQATTGYDGWRHDPPRSGGAVIDLKFHDIDFFNWLLGEPIRVSSQGVRSRDGAISHVWTALDYQNGAQAFVEAGFMFKGNPLFIDFRILCQEEPVEYVYRPSGIGLHGIAGKGAEQPAPSLRLYASGKEEVALHEPAEDSFAAAMRAEIAHFSDCVRNGPDSLRIHPSEARRALEICLCAKKSCEEGHPVEL